MGRSRNVPGAHWVGGSAPHKCRVTGRGKLPWIQDKISKADLG